MILDTNAVSALLAGEPAIAEALASTSRPSLPVVTLGEYQFGILRSRNRESLARLLAELARESEILRIDEATARNYALVRNELKTQGTPIPENDIWIAALSRQHALPVLTRDRHFDQVAGLVRVGW